MEILNNKRRYNFDNINEIVKFDEEISSNLDYTMEEVKQQKG